MLDGGKLLQIRSLRRLTEEGEEEKVPQVAPAMFGR
jgi:hypothetical protein